ncbi:MAG TPA: hypothetical protein VG860_23215 [Terriglobia bacterium]|nr:hypothetical protein [Terriglobia bacterium]
MPCHAGNRLLPAPALRHARFMQAGTRWKMVYVAAGALAWATMTAAPLPHPQSAVDTDTPFMGAYRRAQPIVDWPLKQVLHEIPELKGLKPAADQSALAATLSGAAQRLETVWKDFENTSSIETIEQSRQHINPPTDDVDQAEQRFRYLMLTDPDNPLRIMEYRTDLQGRAHNTGLAVAGFLETSGFASLPLFFDSQDQRLSDFRDFGSQTLHGRSCRVVAFAEHVDPSGVLSRWSIGKGKIPVLIQGVAWIDDNQIVEMRTDLLAPQPSIALSRATTLVTFAPVQFHNAAGALWLPQEVVVTIDLDNHSYINRHRYSDYQLFSVSTGEKPQSPQAPVRPTPP